MATELVVAGTFDSASATANWVSLNAADLTVESGRLRVTNSEANAAAATTETGSMPIATTLGATYRFRVDAFEGDSGGWIVSVGAGSFQVVENGSGDVSIDETFVAGGTSAAIRLRTGSDTPDEFAEFDNVSLQEMPASELAAMAASVGAEPGGRGWTRYPRRYRGRRVPTPRRRRDGERRTRANRNYGPSLDDLTPDGTPEELRAKLQVADKRISTLLREISRFESELEDTTVLEEGLKELMDARNALLRALEA